MALFDPNRKVKKVIKELQKSGASPEAYKTRKSCYNCKYYSSIGNCNHMKSNLSSHIPAIKLAEWAFDNQKPIQKQSSARQFL